MVNVTRNGTLHCQAHVRERAVLRGRGRPMSRLDRIKELLGWLKVLFVTLVAIDV